MASIIRAASCFVLFCFVVRGLSKTLQIDCSRRRCPLLKERHAALLLLTSTASQKGTGHADKTAYSCGPVFRERFLAFQGGRRREYRQLTA
ncbi:hypothetical protein LI328DRAFT_126081 [Trichoderma asperelloides]|nr:hypothetical protein LI328DRAFT_126081 [Trichoderma asperelloides]